MFPLYIVNKSKQIYLKKTYEANCIRFYMFINKHLHQRLQSFITQNVTKLRL